MRVFITGVTGFVGTYLSTHFLQNGDTVAGTGARAKQTQIDHPHFTYISTDTSLPGEWQQAVSTADVVINLAGRSIFKRWTKAYKKEIYDSRIATTRHLVEALPLDKAVDLFRDCRKSISSACIGLVFATYNVFSFTSLMK